MPVTDPGIGTGVGAGFFTSLLNPGLATRVAQHLTPNPSPLAQQGVHSRAGGCRWPRCNPVPSPGSNLAPSAATQPDPVNAPQRSEAVAAGSVLCVADFTRYNRMNQLSLDDLQPQHPGRGRGIRDRAATSLQAGGPSARAAASGIASAKRWPKSREMQDQTIHDNEHACFMGNAAVFAQSMSQQLGRPVSVAEATEWMNNSRRAEDGDSRPRAPT